jgi:CheY-like chemotaxis protein/two-component sensor histidine kinase
MITEGLEVIERNSKVQAQLIEDLLDLSRIISGKLRLDVQSVNLAEVIEAAIASVRPAAEAKDIRLRSVLDSLAAPVNGDPARLQQVVWNLLSNAVKFTPRGGQVQIVLERVNSHVEIIVSDTGMGIKPEFLPFVFDRFRQADASTTRKHGGLGLGLSIVRQLVEMHGGNVRAKSPGEGQGATFSIELPISIAHAGAHRRTPNPPDDAGGALASAPLDGVRVLVVDDEPDARELARQILGLARATVKTAGSAAEALEQLAAERPDVLVSDIGMPVADGYELIRRVRELGWNGKQLPAVALTAFARPEDRRRALLAGFQTHVSKPVDPDELIAIVATLLGRTGGSAG